MFKISDYNRYIDLMKNGFYDKLFFIDKLFGDWETLVDFGCADGFSTKILATIFPTKKIIGYDSDKKMINIARNTGQLPSNVSFTSNKDVIRTGDILFLCSVMHEVHAYQTIKEVEEFYKWVFSDNWKYVIIRDMIGAYNHSNSITTVQEKKVREYCERMGINGELERFENQWGSISRTECLIHWMMKYLYVDSPNWNRELFENYTGVNVHSLSHAGYLPVNWEIEYKELYILPFLKHKWVEDFDITGETPMPINTHGKFIFKNKNK